jgi:hypothetical protein
MLTTRLALWFLLAWLSDAADVAEDGIQAELEANQNNLTALRTITAPPWVSEASFRGTTGILWSCLVTLVACILHGNPLEHTHGDWHRETPASKSQNGY